MSKSTVLKEEFLNLLEEGRNFRYVATGLLRFKEILNMFTKLEEMSVLGSY